MKPSLCVLVLSLFATTASQGVDPVMLKLHGHWAKPVPTDYRMGYPDFGTQMVACNEKWIAAGSSRASDSISREGAVQVFNAVTGAWARKLTLQPAVGNAQFGASVAVIGDRAVIGAPGAGNNSGAAYVFNLTNGSQLMQLKPNVGDLSNGDALGSAIAIAGDKILVGAQGDDAYRGSCYVFDLKTGTQLAKLQAPGGAINDSFGVSVAAEGSLALIGAPGADFKGAGYLFDLTTFGFIRKLQSAQSALGDSTGYSAALHQGKAMLGAPGADTYAYGIVYSFDLQTGAEGYLYSVNYHESQHFGLSLSASRGQLLVGSDDFGRGSVDLYSLGLSASSYKSFEPPDPLYPPLQKFGETVALCGNTAVVAAPLESTQAEGTGALYLIRPAQNSMPLVKRAAKGDFAPGGVASVTVPGTIEINYATLGECFMNPDGEIGFTGTLAGPGSGGGKDTGGWCSLPTQWSGIDLALKSRQIRDNVLIGVVSNPLINHPDTAIFRATLTGKTTTAATSKAIYRNNGQNTARVLRTGDAPAALSGGVLSGFTNVVQNRAFDRFAITCTLKTGSALNDSGLLWQDAGTAATDGVREGSPAPSTGVNYGQFTGRIASYYALATYATALTGAPLTNQAVLQKSFGNPAVLVAQKNDPAAGGGGARFAAFIGESSDADDTVLYKATLSGAPTASNEGLWTRTTGGTTAPALRKGDALPGLPAVKILKIISYWQTAGQTLVLTQLTGTDVKAANDQALLLYQPTVPATADKVMVLMREGDPAPGCEAATIGTINRVDVDPRYGQYFVLATLAGAAPGTELTLFRGHGAFPAATVAEFAFRRPFAILRKGMMYDNQPSKLKSIALPVSNLPASGAGATGLGSAVQEPASTTAATAIAVSIEFDNGVRQIMTGRF